MEKKPSLEHSILHLQERIEYLKGDISFYSLCELDHSGLSYLNRANQELAGHQQALKVLNNHYQLLEALKGLVNDLDGEMLSTGVMSSIHKAEEAIKQAEA